MAKNKKAKAIKLTGNSQQDYQIGVRVGHALGVKYGFQTALYMALPAYYNTKPDDIISDEEFGKWVARAEPEALRIFNEDMRGDFDLTPKAIKTPEDETKETIEDNISYGMGKIQKLRRHLGLEEL